MPVSRTDTWIFDLDNTLYPARCNLFAQVDRRMGEFISAALEIDRDEARRVQKRYYLEHGTTLRGLMDNHGIAPEAFLDYVHDIDLAAIEPDAELDRLIGALPGRKLIFTNGSLDHAERIAGKLGVRHHFEDIFDIVAADYVPKPAYATYAGLVERYRIEPARAVMIDDLPPNLEPAHRLGMTTCWVRTEFSRERGGGEGPHVHHATDDLAEWLAEILAGTPAPRPAG
jgi:putative hydrolase of the HAD superfamily